MAWVMDHGGLPTARRTYSMSPASGHRFRKTCAKSKSQSAGSESERSRCVLVGGLVCGDRASPQTSDLSLSPRTCSRTETRGDGDNDDPDSFFQPRIHCHALPVARASRLACDREFIDRVQVVPSRPFRQILADDL